MATAEELTTAIKPTWCPGCGNYGIWMALKGAIGKANVPHEKVVIVYGVGCHGNMRDWMHVYGVEGLHGRAIPMAQGIKLANPELTVIVVSGDGDCLGEGGNHFLHASKRNPDITVILHDNQVYGLTTGQASPTAKKGFKTKSTPEGSVDEPVNPLALSLIAGATFVSRGFSGELGHLTDTMTAAITHKGFSVVDVLQPCVTFDKVHTYQWYRERVYKLDDTHNPADRGMALSRALEWGDRIPLGLVYRETRETSEEREAALANGPLSTAGAGIPQKDGILALFR
jgi:2-oxoglutarate ferredoxin oxidoreductase subunit beta